MTSSRMGKLYMLEARGRIELVRLARTRDMFATVVRESQESIELFLKGALRIAAIEPARTHDVGEILRRERARFPAWFQDHVDDLATISAELAGDRGIAYYGDERQGIGPQELFDGADADRALEQLEFVAEHCERLLAESGVA
jgi:HEPN domain-containing protein